MAGLGAGGSVFGTSRGGEGAGGGFRGRCCGTEVGLVMILVSILVVTGVKLTPVATLESCWSSLVYCVWECPSL